MNEQKEQLEKLKVSLEIDKKRTQISDLKTKLADENTWKNWEEGQKVAQALSALEKEIEDYEMLELLLEENDPETFEKEFKKVELKTFLSDPLDKGSAILSIHAGQGGTEAMDWSEMLYRMYLRYAEKKGWKTEEINRLAGEEAGIKTVEFEIDGNFAYGFLKQESGVHRLVRQSPFNADSLRQTSFALVEVIPVIDSNIDIEVKDEDLE